MTINTQVVKETGATFTPPELAYFIADRILVNVQESNEKLQILDPACGEGVLLSSIAHKLESQNIDFKLIGYDTNKTFLQASRQLLSQTNKINDFELRHRDFLKEIAIKTAQAFLFQSTHFDKSVNNTIGIVIANPPYVRTQILGSAYAQEIAKKFDLKGRIDLCKSLLANQVFTMF